MVERLSLGTNIVQRQRCRQAAAPAPATGTFMAQRLAECIVSLTIIPLKSARLPFGSHA
jgi:hypothetical protein